MRCVPRLLVVVLLLAGSWPLLAQTPQPRVRSPSEVAALAASGVLDCATAEARALLADHVARVRAGLLPVPDLAGWPPPASGSVAGTGPGLVTSDDIFPFEDSAQILMTNWDFSNDLLPLMVAASNAVIAEHGDAYDFVGFWTNFDPQVILGAAFYAGIFNDATGLGQDPFDSRADIGLATSRVQGWVMMWNVNTSYWNPGTGSNADFTRLALGQEFEHRFAMFLPPLLTGQELQGDNGACGRSAHWSWKVDGQGSSMEIAEWAGSNPATATGLFVSFNTDIPGSVFSYTDLYLMGFVTPAEMDAGNSELRFLETSDCSDDYFGAVTAFDSSDIIAAAGPRVPDAGTAQQDYRTAWVMLHLPGDAPSQADKDKAVAILNQHTLDWSVSTLGRGTMDNTLGAPVLVFSDLGNGLAGQNGPAVLTGESTLQALDPIGLTLANSLPSALVALVIGFSTINAPFNGGVFVPAPDQIHFLGTDGSGDLDVSSTFPGGVPSGTELDFQYWWNDPGGPFGWAASNAVQAITP